MSTLIPPPQFMREISTISPGLTLFPLNISLESLNIKFKSDEIFLNYNFYQSLAQLLFTGCLVPVSPATQSSLCQTNIEIL